MAKDPTNKKLNLRALAERRDEIDFRINEIADLCETENRARTAAEETEFLKLSQERSVISMRMTAYSEGSASIPGTSTAARTRSRLLDGKPVNLELRSDENLMTTDDLDDTGVIPIAEQGILKPLRQRLIYDKVGLTVMTGLSGQHLRWTKHTKATVQFAGEGQRAEETRVDFNAFTVKPVRVTGATPVSREDLESSNGVVEGVINTELPIALAERVNEALFATEGTVTVIDKKGQEKDVSRAVQGPFVEAAKDPILFAGAFPTRKELIKMKAKVASTGIEISAPCFVLNETTKAELEDTKVDAGSGRFVCENDRILGIPVFVHNKLKDGEVGYGDWSYQAAGFFGQMNIAADPYTLLRENSVDFVLNSHFATATLYQEAFCFGKPKA